MTRTPRRLARVGLAGLAALVLTGCGTNQVRTGAAAVVGEERISTEQLQAVVDRGLANPTAAEANADRAAYQRQVLTRIVNEVVLEKAAADAGVSVTEGQVDQQLQELVANAANGSLAELEKQVAEQLGLAASDLRRFVRNLTLDQALGDALVKDEEVPLATLREVYEQSPELDQVRPAHILVPTAAQAQDVLRQVRANPGQFSELARRFSQDTSVKDNGGDLGLVNRGGFAQQSPEFEKAVFGAREGDLLVVRTEFGFHVVQIRERRLTSFQEAVPQLRRKALGPLYQELKQTALREAARELGIRISPRFGTWSEEAGQVVERESRLSRPGDSPADGPADAPGGDPGVPGGDPGAPVDPNAPVGQDAPTQ